MDPPPAPTAAVRRTRALAAAVSLLGLIVLGLAWELWLAPTGRGTLALKVLPLLLPLAGLLRPPLHLPLGQPDGVALFRRRRGARRQRPRRLGALAVLEVVLRWCSWRAASRACARARAPAAVAARALPGDRASRRDAARLAEAP